MKLKISAYDKENKLLFSKCDFDGDIFYDKMLSRISDNLGFTYMSNSLEEHQKKRILLDRRVSNDLRFVVRIAMKDKYEVLGNGCIKDAIRLMSGLDYGNLKEINEYLASNLTNLRNAEKLVFEKINL